MSCKCGRQHSSYHQTLDEMDFERSIHNAVLQNNFERVQKLVHEIDRLDSYGYTPLLYACRKGNVKMCRFLIENGACVDQKTRIGRVSCLHRAVIGGHVEVVQLLVENGADIEYIDQDGRSVRDLLDGLDEPSKSRISEILGA